jgi:hypothetical protein
MEFEEEIVLIRNSKAARIKGWVAIVQNDNIDFLRPIEAEYSKSGMLVWGIYKFANGNFYIVASDFSSHKNSRQRYILYFASDSKLEIVAEIRFERGREFHACDDDIKRELRSIYSKQNERKVISTLLQIAKYYAQREGLIT